MKKRAFHVVVVVALVTAVAWAYSGGWHTTSVPGVGNVQACACKNLVSTSAGGTNYYSVHFAAQTIGNASGYILGLSGNSGRRGQFGKKKFNEGADDNYVAVGEAYGTRGCSLTASIAIRLRMWNPPGGAAVNVLPPMNVEDLPDCEGDDAKPCPPPSTE